MAKAMIVVATKKGYYGDKVRQIGEKFAIKDKTQFSGKWMTTPDSAEGKELHADYASTISNAARTVTDEQMLSEIAEAQGLAGARRAENDRLKAKLKELEAQNAALESKLAKVSDEAADVLAAVEETDGPETEEAETPADAEGETGSEDTAPAKPTRRTRRT